MRKKTAPKPQPETDEAWLLFWEYTNLCIRYKGFYDPEKFLKGQSGQTVEIEKNFLDCVDDLIKTFYSLFRK